MRNGAVAGHDPRHPRARPNGNRRWGACDSRSRRPCIHSTPYAPISALRTGYSRPFSDYRAREIGLDR